MARSAQAHEGKRVLIVDDEEDLRLFIRDLLEQEGYEVAVAADGQVAIEMIGAQAPDLVLLDLMMPRVNGWGVLEWLRGRAQAPPVVVLSGVTDDDTRARSLAEGARACVTKPFRFQELLAACANVVAGAGGGLSAQAPPAAAFTH